MKRPLGECWVFHYRHAFVSKKLNLTRLSVKILFFVGVDYKNTV